MRILHVEDDSAIARIVARDLMRNLSADVCNVTTAEAAIAELAAGAAFDLVISDYDLASSATGGDVLRWVRENLPEMPFLFLSGNEAIEKLGAPWLAKPAFGKELRESIEILNARRWSR